MFSMIRELRQVVRTISSHGMNGIILWGTQRSTIGLWRSTLMKHRFASIQIQKSKRLAVVVIQNHASRYLLGWGTRRLRYVSVKTVHIVQLTFCGPPQTCRKNWLFCEVKPLKSMQTNLAIKVFNRLNTWWSTTCFQRWKKSERSLD